MIQKSLNMVYLRSNYFPKRKARFDARLIFIVFCLALSLVFTFHIGIITGRSCRNIGIYSCRLKIDEKEEQQHKRQVDRLNNQLRRNNTARRNDKQKGRPKASLAVREPNQPASQPSAVDHQINNDTPGISVKTSNKINTNRLHMLSVRPKNSLPSKGKVNKGLSGHENNDPNLRPDIPFSKTVDTAKLRKHATEEIPSPEIIKNKISKAQFVQLREADSPQFGDFECGGSVVPKCCAFEVESGDEAKGICNAFAQVCKGFVISAISTKSNSFQYLVYLKNNLHGVLANFLTDFYVKVDYIHEIRWRQTPDRTKLVFK